ncbi:MAG TPA: vWA domain-containing protein [Dictyobacter sp.]|jgi:uncharacterized protein YegL|nr:vWA domain-containing protein [Dictyobacter sp.]
MNYSLPATTLTPALVVFLIDTSDSMNEACDNSTKIEIVNASLREAVRHMIRRSMRDGIPQPQYQVAIISYNTQVENVLRGIRSLPELVSAGVPKLEARGETNTVAGFLAVEELLTEYIASLERNSIPPCPAPLVCHLTDAHFSTEDPDPVVKRIRAMKVADGSVLVENVYIADEMLVQPIADWTNWKGLMRENELKHDDAKRLFRLSSPLPDVYRQNINNYGYHLQKGSVLFFPGTHRDLVRLAFAISAGTHLK